MEIQVKITRQENADHFSVPIGTIQSMDMEEYLCGVVPAEVGNAAIEACKAQAVTARTYALPYALKGDAVSDSSSVAQAYRAPRGVDSAYSRAHQGVADTAGQVLFYNGKVLATCSYSASNGGRTTSSVERWGGHRPYLIAQDDPWDFAATGGKKTGHGVGLSQAGIAYAAKLGVGYREMLAFYYSGTELRSDYGDGEEGGGRMGMTAKQQVDEFGKMIGWRYQWGSAKEGCVDCSGAFVYAMKKYGLSIYHGSNTIWRKHLTDKGKIGEIELVPGMAVFRNRNDGGEPDKFRGDGFGNMFHVGLYVGDGKVIEAKSTKDGVVQSSVQGWTHAGRVKGIDYSDMGGGETGMGKHAKVTTESGALNLRSEKSTFSASLAKIPKGTMVEVLDDSDSSWWRIAYNGKTGYGMASYLTLVADNPGVPGGDGAVTLVIPCANATEAERMLALFKAARVQ